MIHPLGDETYINLVTFRRNGDGVRTPVWVAAAGEHLYVFTDGTSAKVKRLRATSRIRAAACDVRGKPKGPWHEGIGRIVDDAPTIEKAYAALRTKYGWQMTVVDIVSRLAGRFGRRVILELSLDS